MSQVKIIGGGVFTSGTELGIDPTFLAAHVSARPLDYALGGQILGHYRLSFATGDAAFVANSIIFQMRYGDADSFFVLLGLSISIVVVTAVTAQRVNPIRFFPTRSYTVAETINTQPVIFTGAGNTNGKARSMMGTSRLVKGGGQLASASIAAGMLGGVGTDDQVHGLSVQPSIFTTVGTAIPDMDFLDENPNYLHPYVFSVNEGFRIRWPTLIATGTIGCTLNIRWAEVSVF